MESESKRGAAKVNLRVREAHRGDESLISELIKELAEAVGEPSPVTEDYVRNYLIFPGSGVLLAEEDGKAVGLLSYSARPNLYHAAASGLIEELVVARSARGRGVGSALLTDLIRRLDSMGCAEVSVSTMPENLGAQRFYRSHGLVEEAVFLEKHF
jgi:ribosomal protein S18 acetylase RimI-like enzyme